MKTDRNDISCFEVSPYLDYDEDNIFLEWYLIEGEDRIKELSRQLRTFLNYKKSIIYLRFSRSQSFNYTQKEDLIIKNERALNTLTSQLITLLKMIGSENDAISERIIELITKIKSNPTELELDQFKDLNSLSNEVWTLLHILSELEIHNHPRLMKRILVIASICCEIKSALFPFFSEYYIELQKDYLLLEKEISGLIRITTNDPAPSIKKRIKVRVLE